LLLNRMLGIASVGAQELGVPGQRVLVERVPIDRAGVMMRGFFDALSLLAPLSCERTTIEEDHGTRLPLGASVELAQADEFLIGTLPELLVAVHGAVAKLGILDTVEEQEREVL